MNLLDFLTPGINGGAPDYRQDLSQLMMQKQLQQQGPPQSRAGSNQGVFGKLDSFMGTPGGGFLMNLLAQSGYSTMPHSPLGAIGKAALMTRQQQQAQSQSELQRRLIESTIGLRNKQAENAGADSKLRTQSTRTLANGNIGIVTNDPTNPVIDTGFKEAGKGQILNVPGYGLLEYDPVSQSITQVGNERIILEGGAARKGAESQASTAAQESTKQQFTIPKQIQAARDQIRSIDSTIEEAWRAQGLVSPTSTGAMGDFLKSLPVIGKMTDAFALQEAIKPIQAALSFDKLQQMRASSPTGGALGQVSERELELLGKGIVSLEQAQRPGDIKRALAKVIRHYENWKAIIVQHEANLTSQKPEAVSGFSIVDPNEGN